SWRPVQVLSLRDDAANVTGALQAGEQVVALGAHLLHDGEPVRTAQQNDGVAAGSRP
ncbi:TPA: efflux RND transporter periplasmic adaptor subunit, partial [Serratia marcescens]